MTGTRATILLSAATLLPHLARGQPAAGVEPFDELFGIVISLVVVVGVILVGAWVLRRSPLGAVTRRTGPLKVIATLPLGPKERLVLIEAAGCRLLVGVSPAGIFALHRGDEGDSAGVAAAGPVAERLGEASFHRTIDPAHLARVASETR